MKLLIIGGGIFVGRALVESALDRGHQVTCFSRGKSAPPRLNRIETLVGDRDQDLSAIEGGSWDAVIDTCAYHPESVERLLAKVRKNIRHYTVISSVSAYADLSQGAIAEDHDLHPDPEGTQEKVTLENYGPLKAAVEGAAASFPSTLIIRPGIIVGPYDQLDRFNRWVRLVDKLDGMPVPPGYLEQAMQVIDVRDMADWIIRLVEDATTGAFNAVGPEDPTDVATTLREIAKGLGKSLELRVEETATLQASGIDPDNDYPLRISSEGFAGIFHVDGSKAWTHGLSLRPISQTASDTYGWLSKHHPDDEASAALAKKMVNLG